MNGKLLITHAILPWWWSMKRSFVVLFHDIFFCFFISFLPFCHFIICFVSLFCHYENVFSRAICCVFIVSSYNERWFECLSMLVCLFIKVDAREGNYGAGPGFNSTGQIVNSHYGYSVHMTISISISPYLSSKCKYSIFNKLLVLLSQLIQKQIMRPRAKKSYPVNKMWKKRWRV